MAGDCHTIAAEPRKLPTLVDLSDELSRTVRLMGAMHLCCLGDDNQALIELSQVLDEKLHTLFAEFERFRKSVEGA